MFKNKAVIVTLSLGMLFATAKPLFTAGGTFYHVVTGIGPGELPCCPPDGPQPKDCSCK